jgi:hypothetical protein
MMERYSLWIMPGMRNNVQRGGLMTHLFLCFSTLPKPPYSFEIKDWIPSEHPHPSFSNEKFQRAKTTPRTISCRTSGHWRGVSVSTIYILEREFVEKALDDKSGIERAVREIRLEVLALGQNLRW